MTNEEKSTQLSRKHYQDEDNAWARVIWKSACMEMAKWKDEQIKNKIEQFFAEHDDYDYEVNYMDDYVDMEGLKNDLIKFISDETTRVSE